MGGLDRGEGFGVTRIHHAAILTRDIEVALRSHVRLLDADPPRVVDVERPGVRLRSAMIPVGAGSGTYLQLIEPIEGPGVKELAAGGEGVLYELALEVADISTAHVAATRAGELPTDISGAGFEGAFLTASSGNRYFYLQPGAARGTRLELIEVAR